MQFKMWISMALVISASACLDAEGETPPTERPNRFVGLSEPLAPIVCKPVDASSQTNDAPFLENNMTRTLHIRSTGPKVLEVRTSAPGAPDKIELRRINWEQDGFIGSSNGSRVGSRLNVHDIVIQRPEAGGASEASEQIIRWSNNDTRENSWKFSCRNAT